MDGEAIVYGLVLVIVGIILVNPVKCTSKPGEGEKIGQVVKVNKEGWVSKTYEAELIRGGLSNGSGTVGTQSFNFTVPSDLVKDVKSFMNSQQEVIINYDIDYMCLKFNSASNCTFLTDIKAKK